MNMGYDKPLYIQPFDHRGWFQTKYGQDFARHIETFNPTFCKVLEDCEQAKGKL